MYTPPALRCAVFCCSLMASLLLMFSSAAGQSTGGRVIGRVADPTGAVISGVNVTLVNEATAVGRQTKTNESGDYTFVEVVPGNYRAEYALQGFKKNVRSNVIVEVNQVVTLNTTMQPGGAQETVEVTSEAPQVDTTSTQLGAVVNDRAASELPLNTRDVYQLLQLQPGVQSQLGANLFYGSSDAGVVTVNGGRGRSNDYMVNGGNANDVFVNLPAIQPSPDAIEEFRVLTNTFDAEYGRNSGSVVNVVTKSGTNKVHGDLFEFFRNTVLDAGNYFDNASGLPTADFKQNQFGGTLGGPIKKDRTFIFGSYEGRRNRQGISSGAVTLPTGQVTSTGATGELGGDFSGIGSQQQFYGSLVDPYFAGVLAGRSTCDSDAMAQETANPFNGYTGGITGAIAAGLPVPYGEIFPGERIPTSCFDPTAVSLLNYLPLSTANPATGIVDTSPVQRVRGDQFTIRLDHRLAATQQLSVYYYFDDSFQFQPFSFFQAAGANVPGFGANNASRFQQWNVSHTWTLGNTAVNEFRFSYFREGQMNLDHPANVSSDGTAHTVCQKSGPFATVAPTNCFQDPTLPTSAGITTLLPGHAGLPDISVNGGFTLGNNFEGELPQIGNVFEFSDNYSKIIGKHSLKFGVTASRQKFDQTLFFETTGLETILSVQNLCQPGINPTPPSPAPGVPGCTPIIIGNDDVGFADSYPDYLLGFVNTYNQGGNQAENLTNTMLGVFAQDSWKVKSNVTLNYGLRWELNTPYGDSGHRLPTFRPSAIDTNFNCQLSADSPGYPAGNGINANDFSLLTSFFGSTDCSPAGLANAMFPLGIVFPGDKVNGRTVPNGLTQTYYKSFAPRIGLAWSPGWSSGFLGKLFGGPGKSSVRMGWGMFYNPMEQLVLEQFSAEPPFGGSDTLFSTLLNAPFEFSTGGYFGDGSVTGPNPFGGRLNPARGSNVDWSQFRPLVSFGEFQPNLRSQYSVQYNLTIQRQLAKDLIFQVGYVGTQGHRLLLSKDINAGNPQTCLDLIAIEGTFSGCGPFGADFGYTAIPANSLPAGFVFHLPYSNSSSGTGPNVPCPYFNAPSSCLVMGPNNPPISIIGTRPYSSPFCQPLSLNAATGVGNGCPPDFVPDLSSIYVQDTTGNSDYNSLQALLEKRFSHGLQFQAAYTFSKSIDNASSFENIVNPFDPRKSRSLSLFHATHRFVFSPVWQLPIPKREGFAGKVANGWQVSGIVTYQTGFPIRILSGDDTELTTSDGDFEVVGQPQITGPISFTNPHRVSTINCPSAPAGTGAVVTGNVFFNPCVFRDSAPGVFGNSSRALCCGPGISQTDFSIVKETPIGDRIRSEFRAEFYNVFNHTQFLSPDGNFSHTATFGTVTSARDPRLIQLALKLLF